MEFSLKKKIAIKKSIDITSMMPKAGRSNSLIAVGQKLFDLAGMGISSKGITFGNRGFMYSPIGKKWGASAWYGKQDKGMGFKGGDYDYGVQVSRSL